MHNLSAVMGVNMTNIDMNVIFYAILQKSMEDAGMLNPDASPKKPKNFEDEDLVKMYEHFSKCVVMYDTHELIAQTKRFNERAQKLHDDYLLNMLLMGLFMMDTWLHNDATTYEKNILLPKVTRSIKRARKTAHDEVIMDSVIAASNMYRVLNGQPELTKEVREARRKAWKLKVKN